MTRGVLNVSMRLVYRMRKSYKVTTERRLEAENCDQVAVVGVLNCATPTTRTCFLLSFYARFRVTLSLIAVCAILYNKYPIVDTVCALSRQLC
jgi:hypothetical protein